MSDAAKKKAKRDSVRQLRGIFFIESNDEAFKLTIKAAQEKLEVPMPAAMPYTTPVNSRGVTCRNIGKHHTKYASVVDTRIRMERAVHKQPKDPVTAKWMNSLNLHNLVHQFFLIPQALKNTECKAEVEKE